MTVCSVHITDWQTLLAESLATAGTAGKPLAADDPATTNARTPTAHSHPTSQVTGLDAALAAKAPISHTHQAADIIGLPGGSSSPKQAIALGTYNVLTNVGATYDAIPQSKGLGFVEVDLTGVTRLDFAVRVNKIGTGTQSWQLWNETDSTELAVVNDAAVAADNRLLSVTVLVGIPTGVKRLRVRAKSTIAADDPVFYGASLRLS